MIYDTGRVCVKLTGKEAGKYCVVIDKLDNNFVLIEGEVTRKRCNISHLEPLDMVLKVSKTSDKAEILSAMNEEGLIAKKRVAVGKRAVKKNAKRTK
ncbi:50S ribosomal protein L14e [Candidatus Woesearchaeota archaeon]|nr:50S ribosomal protein L14e [Candidatus Woesearchaeota archaeon]